MKTPEAASRSGKTKPKSRATLIAHAIIIFAAIQPLGCRSARTFFQMDSDHQSPILGIDLTGDTKSRPAPPTKEGASTTALLTHSSITSAGSTETRPKWPLPMLKPKHMALPRTDVRKAPDCEHGTSVPVAASEDSLF